MGFIKIGDNVLAYHGVMIYDAKVLKIDHGNGVIMTNDKSLKPTTKTQYFVHYQGWHKKWDEWVDVARVLEDTPAHRALQLTAKESADKIKRSATKKKKISTGGIDPALSKQSPFKKQKIDAANDTEEPMPTGSSTRGGNSRKAVDPTEFAKVRQIALQLPFGLKKQLVEDWKHVTCSPLKLVKLPRKPSVAQIIAEYIAFKKEKSKVGDGQVDKEVENVVTLMEGIQMYFDRAVGSILLYRHERAQYALLQKQCPDTPMSQIYGAEHLLRLFVRLPRLLGAATVPERELPQLQPRLNDFLKFMQKHASAWFSNDYDDADAAMTASAAAKIATPATAAATTTAAN